jgi:hypothetical protein
VSFPAHFLLFFYIFTTALCSRRVLGRAQRSLYRRLPASRRWFWAVTKTPPLSLIPPVHAFRPPQGGPTARPDPPIHPTGSSSTRASGVNHPPDSDFGVKNRSNYPHLPSGQTDTAQLGLESVQSGLRHLLGDPRRGTGTWRSLLRCF